MDDWDKFNETWLPEKEDFNSCLNIENTTDAEDMHRKRVCKDFEIKNLWEYHDLCVQSNTLQKNFIALFYGWDSTASRIYSHFEETVYVLPQRYLFDQTWWDERLSWPWIHAVVLNSGFLDWDLTTLTTRLLLHCQQKSLRTVKICLEIHELDPACLLTVPGLPWQAALKRIKVKLYLLTDFNMLFMVKKGIIDMQKLITWKTWKIMIKIRNCYVLNIRI